MDVSVRELKSGLSRYLRQVQGGETILVTSRGKPVAHLVPVRSTHVSEKIKSIPGIDTGSGGKPRGASHPAPSQTGPEESLGHCP